MSTADRGHDLHGVSTRLRTFAEYDLEPAVDDPDCPTELTIFDASADDARLVERWVTIDYKHAWPLEDCR